jgi:Na+-transporting methylmalonyl-CoA/oxaloacetate decarboxylase gamma subunit
MTTVALIIFILSLIVLSGLIGYKIRVIRKYGKELETWNEDVYFSIPKITTDSVINELKESMATTGHVIVLISLKIWIKITYLVKRLVHKFSEKFPKTADKMKINKTESTRRGVSHFMESVSNYKKRLSRLLDKMREEEHKEFVKTIEETKE